METADKLNAARGFIEPLSHGVETEREHGMFVGNLAIRYAMTMLDHFGLGDGDDYPLPIHLDQAKNALTNLVSVIQENIQHGQMAVGGLNEEAEAVQGIGVAPRRNAPADADSAKQPKRSDAPDEYEANLLVKKFLDGHSKATVKDVSEATGISTGRISGLDAWRREMAQRKATKPPPKKSERQLTGEMLAVRGTTTATARAQYLTSVMSSGETAAEAKLKAGRDKEIALANADLQKQITGNESAYATAVNKANSAYDTATTNADAVLKSAKQTALSQLNSALAQSSKDKDTAIAGAERTYDQLVAALDAQYGSSSSNGDTGIEGARRQAAISTRDAQYFAARDTSWAGSLSGSTTIGNTPWTLKATTAANAQAAYSTNRARAQAAHDAALLSAMNDWQTSNRTSTLSLLVAEGQSREAYNKATASIFANWELGIGNLLGDKPAGTSWQGRGGEDVTENTKGGYGGISSFLNFNWFEEDEEKSDTPDRPEEPSTAEYVNDKIVHYRDAIKSTPVGFSWQSPFEKWVQKTVRDLAVDVIAGAVAVSAHDTIKKVDPTANADAAFFLAWAGESNIPSLMTVNDPINSQSAEFLQSLARDKAIELNRGHAGLGVSGTPFMDEVAIEAPTSLLSFGLPKMLRTGTRISKEISEEGIKLVLDAARRVDDEAFESASKARQLLDNADGRPLIKVLDDAPISEVERSGAGLSQALERTKDLPSSASIEEILANKWIPGQEGITITDRFVRFGNLFKMSKATGIEFGLVSETIDGRIVYRLYSGGGDNVILRGGPGRRIIGHTHPQGGRYPSEGPLSDMENINKAFLRSLQSDPASPIPHRRVIWGDGNFIARYTSPIY